MVQFWATRGFAVVDVTYGGSTGYGRVDLETQAADTPKLESRYLDSLVAPQPAGRETCCERSPVHRMGQWRAALITFQGLDDKAVPPDQSRDIVAAARLAGGPAAYLEFPGEGHGFRQRPNSVRAFQAGLTRMCDGRRLSAGAGSSRTRRAGRRR